MSSREHLMLITRRFLVIYNLLCLLSLRFKKFKPKISMIWWIMQTLFKKINWILDNFLTLGTSPGKVFCSQKIVIHSFGLQFLGYSIKIREILKNWNISIRKYLIPTILYFRYIIKSMLWEMLINLYRQR